MHKGPEAHNRYTAISNVHLNCRSLCTAHAYIRRVLEKRGSSSAKKLSILHTIAEGLGDQRRGKPVVQPTLQREQGIC